MARAGAGPPDSDHRASARILPNAAKELKKAGFRVECDIRKESMGAKIKDARNMRIPFMAVVGDKEMQNNTFSIRSRREDQLGEMDLATFVKKLQNDVENKL